MALDLVKQKSLEHLRPKLNLDSKAIIFSKKVTEPMPTRNEITNQMKVKKLERVINSLALMGELKNLDELLLTSNIKEWVKKILANDGDYEQLMQYLLNDFSNQMKTRMRESEKYVIGIITQGKIMLCHSEVGEETISKDWDVFERMVDKDNVIRFIQFDYTTEAILVRFFERNRSDFFITWLGISPRDSFYYFGGRYRIVTRFNGSNMVIEASDEEFEKMIEDGSIKISGTNLEFMHPIELLPIEAIFAGRKKYSNFVEFNQDFVANKYDLSYYTSEYQRIAGSLLPMSHRIYDYEDKLSSPDKKILVKKMNKNFTILFCDKSIPIRKEFLDSITARICNNEKLSIFHAGVKFNASPIQIRSLFFYNELITNNSAALIEFFNKTVFSKEIEKVIYAIIFSIIEKENNTKPLSHFFGELKLAFLSLVEINESTSLNEDDLIETKDFDYLVGDDKSIIERLSADISKKLVRSALKVYFFGFNEKNKSVTKVDMSKYPDDRLENIAKTLKSKNMLSFAYFQKVPATKSTGIIILFLKK